MSGDYGDKSYWNQRYSEGDELFDWYQKYDTIKPLIQDLFKDKPPSLRILNIGCGTSEFGEVNILITINI